MKCQQCEKPATFHITELTGSEPEEIHLCEVCAQTYLAQPEETDEVPGSLANMLAEQIKIGQTAEDLQRLDQRACPICGITFYEFRHVGRLGCPHDYVCFEEEIEPLVVNIHGETKHVGKRPKRSAKGTDKQTEVIRLRRELTAAVEKEDYEQASELRDQIKEIEGT